MLPEHHVPLAEEPCPVSDEVLGALYRKSVARSVLLPQSPSRFNWIGDCDNLRATRSCRMRQHRCGPIRAIAQSQKLRWGEFIHLVLEQS